MQLLYKLNYPVAGKIVKRPSKIVKSPYVADIELVGQGMDEEYLAHSPALGCCGLSEAGCDVIMEKMGVDNGNGSGNGSGSKSENENDGKDKKCKYRIVLSVITPSLIVGIYPKYAENMVEKALQMNLFKQLQNVQKYRREFTLSVGDVVHSKFDFVGLDVEGCPFIIEVKNVPLADYEDLTLKERKKRPNYEAEGRSENTKVAYFPDGYRKHVDDTVSPRALKHIKELTYIKKTSVTRCIMCYVIQRNDVNRFQPSIVDPEYRTAFKEAVEAGVEMITMVVKWTMDGEAYFVTDELPLGM